MAVVSLISFVAALLFGFIGATQHIRALGYGCEKHLLPYHRHMMYAYGWYFAALLALFIALSSYLLENTP